VKDKSEEKFNDLKSVYSWMGVGIEFALVVVFFAYLGKYLDKFQDTSPGFMIMGFFVGFAIEMNLILRRAGVIKSKKKSRKDDKKNH
jgi:F0F1-type ATP synthase assembly protein I